MTLNNRLNSIFTNFKHGSNFSPTIIILYIYNSIIVCVCMCEWCITVLCRSSHRHCSVLLPPIWSSHVCRKLVAACRRSTAHIIILTRKPFEPSVSDTHKPKTNNTVEHVFCVRLFVLPLPVPWPPNIKYVFRHQIERTDDDDDDDRCSMETLYCRLCVLSPKTLNVHRLFVLFSPHFIPPRYDTV